MAEAREPSAPASPCSPSTGGRLEVEAEDEWSLELRQPAVHADDLADPPLETSGSGVDYVGPLWAAEDLSLALTHDGDCRFWADSYGADGSSERIVDQEGAFDASRSFAAGVCWIDVEADGAWTLTADESS